MAGSQQQTQATQIEQQRLGYNGITLTNFPDATSAPAIASGSKVEVNTALYFFGSEESISNWASVGSDAAGFIKLTIAGTAVTASFTETAPIWSESKQGYYATAASTERYIGGLWKATTTVYQDKWLYQSRWKFGIDSTNDEMTIDHDGLIIRQGSNVGSDISILQMRSTDIGHGLTSVAATDSFAQLMKNDSGGGGLRFDVITDGDEAANVALGFNAYLRTTADTADTDAAEGILTFNVKQHDGVDVTTAVAAAGNMFTFRNEDSSKLSIKGNGDITFNAAANTDHTITFATDASILWDESEDEFYFDKSIKVDGGIETDGTKIKTKVVQLGEWDMNTTSSLSVAHGLTSTITIYSVETLIIGDTRIIYSPYYTDFNFASAATTNIRIVTYQNPANTNLERLTDGYFASSTLFNGTASVTPNRGFLVYRYAP